MKVPRCIISSIKYVSHYSEICDESANVRDIICHAATLVIDA